MKRGELPQPGQPASRTDLILIIAELEEMLTVATDIAVQRGHRIGEFTEQLRLANRHLTVTQIKENNLTHYGAAIERQLNRESAAIDEQEGGK